MREQRYTNRAPTYGGNIAHRGGPRPAGASRFFNNTDAPDEMHIPVAIRWHADALTALKKLSIEDKIITADTMKTAMARAHWTVTHPQAAKFLFWAYGRRASIGGRWPHFLSNNADNSKLNENAVYSYDAPSTNLFSLFLSLFKKKQE